MNHSRGSNSNNSRDYGVAGSNPALATSFQGGLGNEDDM